MSETAADHYQHPRLHRINLLIIISLISSYLTKKKLMDQSTSYGNYSQIFYERFISATLKQRYLAETSKVDKYFSYQDYLQDESKLLQLLLVYF